MKQILWGALLLAALLLSAVPLLFRHAEKRADVMDVDSRGTPCPKKAALPLPAAVPPPAAALTLQVARYAPTAAVADGAMYVFGGLINPRQSAGRATGLVERFTVESVATEIMPQQLLPRYWSMAATRNGKIYICGGDVRSVRSMPGNTLERYDPAEKTIELLEPMLLDVRRAGVAVVGDKLYVVGGEHAEAVRRVPVVQIFDFETGEWSYGAPMPVARDGVVLTDGKKIYVPGGYDGYSALRSFFVYDPAADAWERLPDLPDAISGFGGIALEDQLFIFGDFRARDQVVVYDIPRQTWAKVEVPFEPLNHPWVGEMNGMIVMAGSQSPRSEKERPLIQMLDKATLLAAPRTAWAHVPEKAEPPPDMNPPWRYPYPDFFRVPFPVGDFSMTLMDGGTFRLSEQQGKVVVLNFCRWGYEQFGSSLDYMEQLQKDYAGKRNIVFVSVMLDEESEIGEELEELVVSKGLMHGIGFSEDAWLSRRFQVWFAPTLLVIGPDGWLRGYSLGLPKERQAAFLRDTVNLLLIGMTLPDRPHRIAHNYYVHPIERKVPFQPGPELFKLIRQQAAPVCTPNVLAPGIKVNGFRTHASRDGGDIALPVGGGKQLLLHHTGRRMQLRNPYGQICWQRDLDGLREEWIFQPAPDGAGTEVVLRQPTNTMVFLLQLPPGGPLHEGYFEQLSVSPLAGDATEPLVEGVRVMGLPPVFITVVERQVRVTDRASGKLLFYAPLPQTWHSFGQEKMVFAHTEGKSGIAVLARPEIHETASGHSKVSIAVSGMDEKGVVWAQILAGVRDLKQLVALPNGDGSDVILLECEKAIYFFAPDGRLLLENPLPMEHVGWVFHSDAPDQSFRVTEYADAIRRFGWRGEEDTP